MTNGCNGDGWTIRWLLLDAGWEWGENRWRIWPPRAEDSTRLPGRDRWFMATRPAPSWGLRRRRGMAEDGWVVGEREGVNEGGPSERARSVVSRGKIASERRWD